MDSYGDSTVMASELHVDAIKHSGGTSAMTIDSSGRISRSIIPSFKAYKASSGNVTYGASDSISASFDTLDFNIGSHFSTSTGKFTVPIAGLYMFGYDLFNNTTSTASKRVNLRLSSGEQFGGQGQAAKTSDFVLSVVDELPVGETVEIISSYSDTIIYHGQNHSYFWGYFIG